MTGASDPSWLLLDIDVKWFHFIVPFLQFLVGKEGE
jgi:hypothetical protein